MDLFPSIRSSYDNSNASVSNEMRDQPFLRRQQQPVTYTAEKVIGNGSFGVVYQAVALDTKEVVAIKKVYQDRRYKNRELQIMKDLGVHPNIVTLQHAFYTNGDKPDELFLNVVMEFVPDNVYKVLKNHSKINQEIPLDLIKCYSYQLARGIAYMHACGICHRDIKPQNLLICPKTHALKLCDFGSAKRLVFNEPNVSYICSRYYRAPELIFGAVHYTHVVDNWSMGCVLSELVQGSPLFPGENGVDQLVQIIKILGTPTKEQLAAMNPNYSNDSFRFPPISSKTWDKVLTRFTESGENDGIELVSGILQYDPIKRWNSAQILSSSFFDDLKTPKKTNLIFPQNLFDFHDSELEYLKRLSVTSIFDDRKSIDSSSTASSPVANIPLHQPRQ